EQIVPGRRIAVAATITAVALVALALLLAAGPGPWGYGSRHLLLGSQLPVESVPVRRVAVSPGDATVRRNSDVSIRATVEGFQPHDVQVYVRFADQARWERAPMQSMQGQSTAG